MLSRGAMLRLAMTVLLSASPVELTASMEDGLKVESVDGNYGVQLGALVWTRFDAAVQPGAPLRDAFSVPVMRPVLKAHFVRPWVSLFVQPELAGATPRLLDLELDVRPLDAVGLKVGQFITPYSRSFLTPVPKLQFQGFTAANETFRANRDTGAMLYGTFFSGRLEYFAGVFNGNGVDIGFNDNPQLLTCARIAGTLVGRPPPARGHVRYDETVALSGDAPFTVMVGLDGYVNQVTVTAQPEQRRRAAIVDLAVVWGRAFAQAEGYVQGVDTVGAPGQTRWGADGQAGVFLWPQTLELGARVSWVRFTTSDPTAWLLQGDAQLGWYVLGNHLKAVARYTVTDAGAPVRGFATGFTHGVFVQVQAWL